MMGINDTTWKEIEEILEDLARMEKMDAKRSSVYHPCGRHLFLEEKTSGTQN